MKITKIIKKIKKNVFKIMFKFADYENKEKMLRKICYYVGNNTRICNNDFGEEPYMIYIGSNVIVAAGVKFVEHDASFLNVCRYNEVSSKEYEKIGPIILRDNCFVGGYSILLQGADVGENSIIAAGSVVNKKVPANEVWGGVPAHFIMNISDYWEKVEIKNRELPWFGRQDTYSEKYLIKLRQDFFYDKKLNMKRKTYKE